MNLEVLSSHYFWVQNCQPPAPLPVEDANGVQSVLDQLQQNAEETLVCVIDPQCLLKAVKTKV